MTLNIIHNTDCLQGLRELPDCSVNCCVTSPPYYGLRDYGVDGQIGLEETPEAYVEKMVAVFREVRRVLKDDGTLWLNLGDSYWGGKGQSSQAWSTEHTDRGVIQGKQHQISGKGETRPTDRRHESIKPKDLIGIPWMVAFALRADGWYLRQDIIWCLSGGTWLYAKTQKGEMPMMVRDIARLDPSTVKLWNGEKWTRLLGMNRTARRGNELEIVLRSGERISCTPSHKFPTKFGLVEAKDIRVGDALLSCKLPEPTNPRDCAIDNDAAWLAGLYIAEGSMSEDTIQIAGHSKEEDRWNNVLRIATKYGGSATRTIIGNNMNIRIYGKILMSIINELVSGKTSHDKGFAPVVWRYSNSFIGSMVDGYLSGDGHKDGDRWRLGFCRNYNLERDLRTACARLGYSLTLNMSSVKYNGGNNPTFRGELRKTASNHSNNKDRNEVMEIRKSRCRNVWDMGVEDDPHLFALASGILTHNSKPNPMPESVTDRCTKAHEYIFLLSKSARYYYDADAIKTPLALSTISRVSQNIEDQIGSDRVPGKTNGNMKAVGPGRKPRPDDDRGGNQGTGRGIPAMEIDGKGVTGHSGYFDSCGNLIGEGMANKKSVWVVPTMPFSEAHFATFPEKLIVDMIKAGCPEGGIVLDPFMGAGTTAVVARKLNRNYTGFELNPEYIKIADKRLYQELGMFQ